MRALGDILRIVELILENLMKKSYLVWFIICLALSGCSIAASEGTIGRSEHSRFIVLGESVNKEEVQQYANQYNAVVFFTPSRGMLAGAVTRGLTSTLGPSSAMKGLMNEFRSMSNSLKDWEVIIPKRTERYLLITLRNMEDNAVVNAEGKIILPESSVNGEIEKEVARVFGNTFEVNYDKKR